MSVTGKWEVRGLMVMADLDALAKRFHAFEAVDKSEFQRAARTLQSIWREERGYAVGSQLFVP